jgi:ADP-heptose:LPS heptosyltransferase
MEMGQKRQTAKLCLAEGKRENSGASVEVKISRQNIVNTHQHILVSRLRFMGDVILTVPVLSALKKALPEARITYLAEAPYSTLLEHHPLVDTILSIDKNGQLPVIEKLIRSHFDVAIDLFGNPRSALLIWLSGAKMRVGGDFRGRKLLYTHKIRDNGVAKTAIDFHLRYLEPLHIQPSTARPFVIVTNEEDAWAKEFLARKGYDFDRPIIGIHPGATWPAKRWLPERFGQLANKLFEQLGVQVFFTLGPREDDILQAVLDVCKFTVAEPVILPLRQLATLLKQFQVYVTNDCGPMHLAPAVGTKTVAIFGPGEPEIWFPYDRALGHRLVFHDIDCSRCHRDLCPEMLCMQAITVDQVYEQVISAYEHAPAN